MPATAETNVFHTVCLLRAERRSYENNNTLCDDPFYDAVKATGSTALRVPVCHHLLEKVRTEKKQTSKYFQLIELDKYK
ncbi:hypothetical protein JOB18_007461 [Solea senegalensis]|uniref:Uncharacterized protein n=1 Tax=Solea senegalensis TaxID=28829 RepID=A0AAV6RBE4_SOLSE|nr:hypothetical protein JOB18_007461 [Solea senegalensis]